MRRAAPALMIAASALVLTGCGPSTSDIQALAATKKNATYADALDLRDAVTAAGADCDENVQQRIQDGFYGVSCQPDMNLVVHSDPTVMRQTIGAFTGDGSQWHYLHAANWAVEYNDKATLEDLQDALGGQIYSGS